jgi:transcriptional antiterminator RfaH
MSTLPHLRTGVVPDSLNPAGTELWDDEIFSPNWYAVFTLTRHEKRVHTQCENRRIESFLPLYKVKHRWKNRCNVELELPLFPSYTFVRIDPRIRVKVLQLPGVVSMVGSGRGALPVPDDYIQCLRDGLLVHKIEPHPGLAVGDWVRIKTGPMAGSEGILDRRKNDLRVVLRLEMLARSVSVEVGADEVEPCSKRTTCS